MVLVRRRNDFGRALVRALKSLRRAGGRAGPADADRAAGGAGPDGARRCAAAAAGRPDLRLSADQPARRTVRRQPDGSGDRAERPAVGDAARAGRGAAGLAGGVGVLRRLAGAGRLRLAACAVRRGAGTARRAGAAVRPARAGGRRTGGRTAECGAGLRPHAPAVAAGVPALAAPLGRGGEARGGGRRQPGAGDDGARRQGIAGAAGDPAGHHVAAAGRGVDPVGDRSGHRARRADLVAAAGGALRRRPAAARCGEAAADGGAQPAALRRADPRRGPAAGVRLADAARAGRCVLVSAGRARLRRAAGGTRAVRRLGWRAATLRHAADREA